MTDTAIDTTTTGATTTKTLTGTVKMVSERGWGFIQGASTDYFFHKDGDGLAPGIDFNDLVDGDSVQFQAVIPVPARGPRAMHIRPADQEPA